MSDIERIKRWLEEVEHIVGQMDDRNDLGPVDPLTEDLRDLAQDMRREINVLTARQAA